MNFRPELADAILAGRKTVTRRVPNNNPRSPWYAKRCGLRVGQDYAVCPGRGKLSMGRIVVKSAALKRLGYLDNAEARAEGFRGPAYFECEWIRLHGDYNPMLRVWRVEFELMKDAP